MLAQSGVSVKPSKAVTHCAGKADCGRPDLQALPEALSCCKRVGDLLGRPAFLRDRSLKVDCFVAMRGWVAYMRLRCEAIYLTVLALDRLGLLYILQRLRRTA